MVVPVVLDEADVFPFKFWFDDTVHDGMVYQNELFYCLLTVDTAARSRLYHYACRISQGDRLVLTTAPSTLRLWVSLRSANFMLLRLQEYPVPQELKPHSSSS
jgi:hypothetical protein